MIMIVFAEQNAMNLEIKNEYTLEWKNRET
jgi:hypothetical protein